MKHILLLTTFFFFSLHCGIAQKVTVYDLQVDDFYSPMGIDSETPTFSWKTASKEYNVNQTHYQVFVATDAVFSKNSLVWDSGKLASSESVYTVYEGKPLSPDTKYYWTVKVWTSQSSRSSQSRIATWSTGLMKLKNWDTKWITVAEDDDYRSNPKSPYFKNEFKINKKVKSANLHITSRGMYEAYINGKRVGDLYLTPGWTSYNNRIQYQTYNITNLLSANNGIGVILGKGWHYGRLMGTKKGEQNYSGNRVSFISQLLITYEDGTKERVIDDSNWNYSYGAILDSEIYNGEYYDANLIEENWSNYGVNNPEYKSAVTVDDYKGILVSTSNEMIKRQETLVAKELITTPSGDKVIDFGQNLTGWVEFKANGKKGDVVKIQHAEILHKEEFYTDNLRSAKQLNTYVLNGDSDHLYRPHFTFQGFRFIKIEGMEDIDLDDFKAVALYSDMEQSGTFSSSNPLINQLQSNIEWGQKGNFLDVPTDCPQRNERLGWTGDAQAFFNTAGYLRDVKNFFDKWMVDLEYDQYDNGVVPSVIPDVLDNKRPRDGASAGWADAVTIISWNSYLIYGDKEQLKLRYNSMKKWVDYMHSKSIEGSYVGNNHYGDWLFYSVPNDPPGRSAVSNKKMIAQAFYHYSIDLLLKAAKVLENKEDVTHYQNLLNQAHQAFQDEYVTKKGMIASDTQTSYVLALKFNLLNEENKKIAVERLVANVESYGHLTTGFLGTPYLCEILSANGRADLAIKLLLRDKYPSWLYPVTMGATTIWERWNGIKKNGDLASESMNSYNHYAYGAIGEWMYNNLVGLKVNELYPGYKRFTIQPLFDKNFNYISGTYNSNYGNIKVNWSRTNDAISISISIPPNSQSDVFLSKPYKGNWTFNNKKAEGSVLEKKDDTDKTYFLLGSGDYQLRLKAE